GRTYGSVAGIAADEGFHQISRVVVGELARRMFAEIGGGRVYGTGETAVAGYLGATDHVDRHAGGVRAVFHREPELEVHRHAAEELPLHADEADLVVVLPGDIVGRADVDVLIFEPSMGDRLHRLRLRDLLRREPAAIPHVKEVGVSTGVELIGAIQLHAALGEEIGENPMHDGGTQLRLDVVTDHRNAGFAEAAGPGLVARDEDRDVIDERHPGAERTLDVELR